MRISTAKLINVTELTEAELNVELEKGGCRYARRKSRACEIVICGDS